MYLEEKIRLQKITTNSVGVSTTITNKVPKSSKTHKTAAAETNLLLVVISLCVLFPSPLVHCIGRLVRCACESATVYLCMWACQLD